MRPCREIEGFGLQRALLAFLDPSQTFQRLKTRTGGETIEAGYLYGCLVPANSLMVKD